MLSLPLHLDNLDSMVKLADPDRQVPMSPEELSKIIPLAQQAFEFVQIDPQGLLDIDPSQARFSLVNGAAFFIVVNILSKLLSVQVTHSKLSFVFARRRLQGELFLCIYSSQSGFWKIGHFDTKTLFGRGSSAS